MRAATGSSNRARSKIIARTVAKKALRLEPRQKRCLRRIEIWASVGPAAASAGYPTRSGRPGLPPIKPTVSQEPDTGYAVGQVVQHDEYGIGQITDVSGFGALRRIKIRFPSAGEKTFVADKVKLKVVTKK